jgi:putative tryptophan/tyrosine transport system substrate-binding protein
MRRREFITLLSGAAVAWPGIAVSQPGQPVRRIGVLMGTSEGDAEVHPYLLSFQKALQDLGWTQDRNVQIDYRFAVSDPERIGTAAAELLRLKPDVLVARSTPEIRALLELTRTVPIVSPMIADFRSAAGWSRASRDQTATSLGSRTSRRGWGASGSAC